MACPLSSLGRCCVRLRSAPHGGADQAAIEAIRGAGGDVVVSFGGWSGKKLGSSSRMVSTASQARALACGSSRDIVTEAESSALVPPM